MRYTEITTPKIKNVQLVDRLGSEANIIGTAHITTSHFVFKADEGGKEIWIANCLIASVEKTPLTAAGSRIVIKCKHFLNLTLLISKDKDCQCLFENLNNCCRLVNISDSFAFATRDFNEIKQRIIESPNFWQRLNWNKEFERQGVNDTWKESNFNADYKYCDTYPEKLWIPKAATLQHLIGSCQFRSRARLPVLTFFFKPNGASIIRCAQPLSGFSSRCFEDENLMNLIVKTNPSNSQLYLIDTRPRVNAMVNKVQGKGVEDVRNYTNIEYHFFDIENIHVMRTSLSRLLDACQKPISLTDFLKNLDYSGWLKHIRSLMECGKFIADSILRGISCVVHCSDGWDRTSQTISIAQLILDPYFRTIHGFQVLLDKDWLGFGFKFDDRCAHIGALNGDESAKEVSPIFTQFLEVVWQIQRQKPLDFEFNERFLLEINEHAYSCLYGTFLGNCDKDRKDLRIPLRTQSLWAEMDQQIENYINPFYKKDKSFLGDIDLRPFKFIFWTAMYNKFDTGIQPREYFSDIALTTKLHVDFLEKVLDERNDNTKILPEMAIKWQSILNANECSTPTCQMEFISRFERRYHCIICGKIFCQRCFSPKTIQKISGKICNICFSSKNITN